MARVKTRRALAVEVEPEATTSLSRPRASERLRGLLRQQKALLTKIKQEQKQRERLTEGVRATMTAVMSQVQPLLQKRRQLSAALHELFRKLLAEGRLAKRSRRKVEQVYATLQDVLDDAPSSASDAPRASREVQAAGANQASVRDVFRRLALALHPDRATNEHERRHRTEVMKRLSQAYEAGDLAALLEAEERWLSGAHHAANGPDVHAQCSALERSVADLKDQLRRLRTEVKELKRSPELAMANAMKQRAPGASARVLGEAMAEVEADLQHLRELLTLVSEFRDGKLSLAEFLRGAPLLRGDPVDVADLPFARPNQSAGGAPSAHSQRVPR